MTSVTIIGCGPSGLLAAYAAEQLGYTPLIYSKKVKSETRGAMYLHKPIPGIETPKTFVHFDKIGTREGYANKVYKKPDAPCSWDIFPTAKVPAWSLADVYDWLWDYYESWITDAEVGPGFIREVRKMVPFVINTAPAPHFCEKVHCFNWARVWIRQVRSATGDHIPNMIIYNGDPLAPWYRCAHMFGYTSYEFGHPVTNAVEGRKPTTNNCDCQQGVLRLGRFGKWEKKVLTHHAYEETLSALQ